MHTVTYRELVAHTEEILIKGFGYSKEQAQITAEVLVEADSRGIPSHGVARLAFYRMNLKRGFAHPEGMPETVHETPVSLVIDGHSGVGPHIAKYAMDRCIEKAKSIGTCTCVVKNSNHYGIAGYWAELAGKAGCTGMAMTNTRKCCIVTNGKERLLGTNPIACAVPGEKDDMFLLDMATPVVAHGKVEVYDRRNKTMPIGWVVDEDGVDTGDATYIEELFKTRDSSLGGHLFLGGRGEEQGGHKGYGLGMMVELLCSALPLGRWSPETFTEPGKGSGITHYFTVTDLNIFGDASAIRSRVSSMLDSVRKSEKADGCDRIYTHGEKESEARVQSLENGIELDDATWSLLKGYCDEFDITPPVEKL